MDDSQELEKQGSLGAGLCLNDGVEAIARGEGGDFNLKVNFLNGLGDETLYRDLLNILSEEISEIKEYSWELNVKFTLPTSQGFGMSASGAISAANAFQRSLGISHEKSRRRSYLTAHIVERLRSTGLGDTTALASGGVERRITAGSPYSGNQLDNGPGKSEGWTYDIPLILAWKSETGKHTSEYINDINWKNKITKAGMEQMKKLSIGEWNSSRWGDLIESANRFVVDSELIMDSKRADLLTNSRDIIKNCNFEDRCTALLCMLGESIVIVPNNLDSLDFDLVVLCNKFKERGYETVMTRVSSLS
tara:strand:+ start:178 stop:1095 length:918 start_codon:yes stop_codon:yes gene_type:complete